LITVLVYSSQPPSLRTLCALALNTHPSGGLSKLEFQRLNRSFTARAGQRGYSSLSTKLSIQKCPIFSNWQAFLLTHTMNVLGMAIIVRGRLSAKFEVIIFIIC